jgi:hypothetical protein
MIQTEIYQLNLVSGDTIDTYFMDIDDLHHTYYFHTLIFLGSTNDLSKVVINGQTMELSGGFVYNQTPINTLEVLEAPKGVLLIGKKTKKVLFQTIPFDETFNTYVQSTYVYNYFL